MDTPTCENQHPLNAVWQYQNGDIVCREDMGGCGKTLARCSVCDALEPGHRWGCPNEMGVE
ncbi:MAG: hypothetical protein ABIJ75_05070 [Actinomycetota bacterium]